MNDTTKNEYRPVGQRKATEDMTLPELVREFARIKSWFAAAGADQRGSDDAVLLHRRLGLVCTELEKRGALD